MNVFERIDPMKLTLSPKLSKLIEHEVEAGHFATPEEVITAGLTRIFAESDVSDEEIATLRDAVDIGVVQADRGNFAKFTAKDAMLEGRALIAKLAEQERADAAGARNC